MQGSLSQGSSTGLWLPVVRRWGRGCRAEHAAGRRGSDPGAGRSRHTLPLSAQPRVALKSGVGERLRVPCARAGERGRQRPGVGEEHPRFCGRCRARRASASVRRKLLHRGRICSGSFSDAFPLTVERVLKWQNTTFLVLILNVAESNRSRQG